MTALIGGSLLLIATSAIALVIGWTSADESLIMVSIAASVGAAIMLALGYARSKAEAARRPARPAEERTATPRPAPTPTPTPAAATAPAVAAAPAPAARARPEPAATQPVPVVASADDDEDDEQRDTVVAYPDRSRFHRADCRYAAVVGGEKIPRATAVRRGYDPCGVCKP